MNCAEIKKYLDAYVDGELDSKIMFEVESHLDDCETCSSLDALKQRMKAAIALAGDQTTAPEHLKRKIQLLSARRNKRLWTIGVVSTPLATAAAVMLILNLSDGQNKNPLTAVVDDVVRRHTRELPMEVQGNDFDQAASWFQGKVDFPVRAPSLKLKNASFKGARLSNVQSNQAAHMVYNVDGRRVTLMIFSADKLGIQNEDITIIKGKKMVIGRRNGFNVVVMLDKDMAYALSSDLSSKRLLALFAELII